MNKKLQKFMLKFVICLTLTNSIVFAENNFQQQNFVFSESTCTKTSVTKTTTANLNLRTGPSTNDKIILTIPKAAVVNVLSTSGTWVKVTYKNNTGYVSSIYLKNSSTTTPSTSTKKYEVTTDSLNIRSSASTSSTILGKLSKGTKIDVISITNGWAKFKYNNKDAYVSTQYLKLLEGESKFCTVTQDVYLRKEKDWSSEKIQLVEKGEKLECINKDAVWTKVKVDNKEGYISNNYINTSSNDTTIPSQKIIKYTTTVVNFRKGPSTTYQILKSLSKGTQVTILETKNDWDKVDYNGQIGYVNNLYLSTTNSSTESGTGLSPSPEFAKTKIVIDAGHGGVDAGAVGKYKKLKEKDLALEVTLKVNKELTRLGFKTILTRSSDVYPSLSSRYTLANNNNANLFLSVHFNSSTNETASGIETLYKNNSGFANSLQNALIKETNAKNRGLKYRNDLAVLNGSKMNAALVELGFLSNKNEESLISTTEYKNKLANALVKGIVNYVK